MNNIIICRSKYPQVILYLKNLYEDNKYNELIETLDQLYEENRRFNLLIDTYDMKNVKIKYLYFFGNYLNELKNKPKLLEYTIIEVYNDYIYNLLYFLFTYLSRPVAKVTVIHYRNKNNHINNDINNHINNIIKIKDYFP